jgi:hypothetical protein
VEWDEWRERRTQMLNAATIVGATLSGAALDAFASAASFHTVIIDEAAQAVEPAALVPLTRTLASSCVLVGALPPHEPLRTSVHRSADTCGLTLCDGRRRWATPTNCPPLC